MENKEIFNLKVLNKNGQKMTVDEMLFVTKY